MNFEMIILNLITNSGEAKSYAMEAIAFAKEGKQEEALKAIDQATENLTKAHKSQTELIQAEARGESVQTSILLIHAQDHLMNAITVRDLAREMVDMYALIYKNK